MFSFGPDYLLGLHAEHGSTLPDELQSNISETAHSCAPSYAFLVPLLRDVPLSDTPQDTKLSVAG